MTASIIDGAAASERVRAEVAEGVRELVAAGGPVPGLATVLVGSDPASQVYVRNKQQRPRRRACAGSTTSCRQTRRRRRSTRWSSA